MESQMSWVMVGIDAELCKPIFTCSQCKALIVSDESDLPAKCHVCDANSTEIEEQ